MTFNIQVWWRGMQMFSLAHMQNNAIKTITRNQRTKWKPQDVGKHQSFLAHEEGSLQTR